MSNTPIPIEGVFTESDTLLLPTDPRLAYQKGTPKTSIHYGQLKLLISEIYFLTLYSSPQANITVVYAGAAPGIHIAALSYLFPTITFHLYDPAHFKIKPSDRIKLYNQFFTEETARQWAEWKKTQTGNWQLFFISDIRSIDEEDLNPARTDVVFQRKIETAVDHDMRLQERCYYIIGPTRALLKTRIPYAYDWAEPTYTYLNGYLFKQAFAPQSSTETRLVPYELVDVPVTDYPRANPNEFPPEIPRDRVYDIKEYEEQMFYFNVVVRGRHVYTQSLTIPALGITQDYDSSYFMYVMLIYQVSGWPHCDEQHDLAMLCSNVLTMTSQNPNANRIVELRCNPIKSTTKAAKMRQVQRINKK